MNHPAPQIPDLDCFEKLAVEVQDFLLDRLRDSRGVHLETAISGIAAVAGCLLLRATGVPLGELPPGAAVFVDAADAAGAVHFVFLSAASVRLGLDPGTSWTDLVPVLHQPLKPVPELTQLLEVPFGQLCDRFSLANDDRPRLALFTAARLIRLGQSEQLLAPEIGQALALAALVAGTKTVPPLLSAHPSFWQKLFA